MRAYWYVLALSVVFTACPSKKDPAPAPATSPAVTTGAGHEAEADAAPAPAPADAAPAAEPAPADAAPAAEPEPADTATAPEPEPADTATAPEAPTADAAPAASADPRPKATDPTCMPAWYGDAEYGLRPRLTLGRVGDQVVLCAVDQDHEHLVGALGCWRVDPETGALSAHAAALPPGQGRVAKVAGGCVLGFCAEGLDREHALVAANLDGTRVVVLGDREPRFHVFDAATRKELKAFVNSPEEGLADDSAISNEPIEIYYVGHRIYVVGTDAGPWMGVWVFGDDGARLGAIKEGDSLASLWGGSFNVLDDGHVGLSLRGLDQLLVLDAADGKPTALRRATPKSPCSPEELDLMGDAAEEGSACAQHIARVFLPWSDARLVTLPAGGFLAVQPTGELVRLDAKLAETKRFPAPFCK